MKPKQTKAIKAYIPKVLYEKLKNAAEVKDISMSQFIKNLLEECFNDESI